MIDNCPANPQIENLKAIKLFFVPPITTFKIQPMDQGVIGSLKAKCCTNLVRKIIRSVENKTLGKISLLKGMQMLVATWYALTSQTIVNCLRKSGLSSESKVAAIDQDDDHFQELQDKTDNLCSVQPHLIAKNIDAASYSDVNAEVANVELPSTDAKDVNDDDNSVDVNMNQWSALIEMNCCKLSKPCEDRAYLQTRGILSSSM